MHPGSLPPQEEWDVSEWKGEEVSVAGRREPGDEVREQVSTVDFLACLRRSRPFWAERDKITEAADASGLRQSSRVRLKRESAQG